MTTLTAPQADLDALRTPAAAAAHRVAGERPAAAADALARGIERLEPLTDFNPPFADTAAEIYLRWCERD